MRTIYLAALTFLLASSEALAQVGDLPQQRDTWVPGKVVFIDGTEQAFVDIFDICGPAYTVPDVATHRVFFVHENYPRSLTKGDLVSVEFVRYSVATTKSGPTYHFYDHPDVRMTTITGVTITAPLTVPCFSVGVWLYDKVTGRETAVAIPYVLASTRGGPPAANVRRIELYHR